MSIGKFLCAYLLLMNLLTFIIFGMDKTTAIKHQRRVKERTLLFLSGIGGWTGGWMAMFLFRHKIKDYGFLPYMIFISLSWLIGIVVFLTLNPKGT